MLWCIKRPVQAVIFTALATVSLQAFAQQQIPASTEPGQILQESTKQAPNPSSRKEVISLPEIDSKIDPSQNEKLFVLQSVTLANNTVYSQEEINAVIADKLGQSVSFADMQEIAQRLTIKYREDGYMFSRVILVPQTIDNGSLKLDAIEGRITEVSVVGDYVDHFDRIKKMADRIRSEGPSNTEDLERYLLLIDDLPGISAKSLLRASDTPGGGELVISIEQDPAEASLGLDNRGSRFLGQHRGTAVAAFNSLLGIHDRTTIRGIMSLYANQTDELRFFDLTHEEQVGYDGLRVVGRVAATSTNPGGRLEAQQIEGNSQLLELSLLYPLIRSRDFNVNLKAGYHHLHSESDIAGIQISRDRVRSVTAGASVDFFDKYAGINQIDFEVAKGLTIFNATDDGLGRSRVNGDHTFTRAKLTATRVQDLWWQNWSAYASVEGQYAWDALLASEEFAIGGPVYGRAFDAAELTGDHGLAGVLEIRYGRQAQQEWLSSYQFFGFYDIGAVWNKGNIVGENRRDSLASVGAGVRFNLQDNYSGSFEVDKPLTREVSAESVNGDDGVRAFFSILKRF